MISDGVFAFILALSGVGAVGFIAVMTIVPFIEARERRRAPRSHPAE
jgi:hypothetical protein